MKHKSTKHKTNLILAATACTILLGTLNVATVVKADVTTSTNAQETTTVQSGRDVPYYKYDITKDLSNRKDKWESSRYYLEDGTMATDCFFSDGIFTYYLQSDGSPMKNRLTYHPDGEHIIYFDKDGHEVFDDFANISQSISGDSVDDICYFNTYGYMYVDTTTFTYDFPGNQHEVYINKYGVVQKNGWFQYSDGTVGYATTAGYILHGLCEDPSGNVYYMGHTICRTSLSPIPMERYEIDPSSGWITASYTNYGSGWKQDTKEELQRKATDYMAEMNTGTFEHYKQKS